MRCVKSFSQISQQVLQKEGMYRLRYVSFLLPPHHLTFLFLLFFLQARVKALVTALTKRTPLLSHVIVHYFEGTTVFEKCTQEIHLLSFLSLSCIIHSFIFVCLYCCSMVLYQ